MKKMFLMCMMAVMALSAQAQFYVGGSIGLSTQKDKVDGASVNLTQFDFTPEFGFNFNDYWAVGGTLGVSCMASSDLDQTSFNIMPYVRGTYAHTQKVDFFIEGTIGYQFYNVSVGGDGENLNGFSLGIRPGILVKLTPKCHLLAKMTLLDYSYVKNDLFDLSHTGFAIGKQFSIGAVYNF